MPVAWAGFFGSQVFGLVFQAKCNSQSIASTNFTSGTREFAE
jgi:hypothetical protein